MDAEMAVWTLTETLFPCQ